MEESSDDEESDHPDSDDEDGPTRKRRRQVDRRERRRAHEEWMDKRNELIFNYTQFSYFGPPVRFSFTYSKETTHQCNFLTRILFYKLSSVFINSIGVVLGNF